MNRLAQPIGRGSSRSSGRRIILGRTESLGRPESPAALSVEEPKTASPGGLTTPAGGLASPPAAAVLPVLSNLRRSGGETSGGVVRVSGSGAGPSGILSTSNSRTSTPSGGRKPVKRASFALGAETPGVGSSMAAAAASAVKAVDLERKSLPEVERKSLPQVSIKDPVRLSMSERPSALRDQAFQAAETRRQVARSKSLSGVKDFMSGNTRGASAAMEERPSSQAQLKETGQASRALLQRSRSLSSFKHMGEDRKSGRFKDDDSEEDEETGRLSTRHSKVKSAWLDA